MKNLTKTLILIVLLGCTNSNNSKSYGDVLKEEEKSQITNTNLNKNNEVNIVSELDEIKEKECKLNLINLKSNKSYKTRVLQTDSFRYQVYITLNDEKLTDNIFVTIDSIKFLEPFISSIKHSDELAMGGYLNLKQSYKLGEIVKFIDINRDKRVDIMVYNPLISGSGHNTCYNAFLNKSNNFEYSDEFTKPNLKYNEETKTYSDWGYGGMAGLDYSTRTYVNKYDTLIEIMREEQEYNQTKDVFIRRIENMVTGKVEIKEIKHER